MMAREDANDGAKASVSLRGSACPSCFEEVAAYCAFRMPISAASTWSLTCS